MAEEGVYRTALAEIVDRFSPRPDRGEWSGVEVGVADGKAAEVLLRRHPQLVLYLVDPYWGDLPHDDPYWLTGDTQARMTQYKKSRQMVGAMKRLAFSQGRARFVAQCSVEAAAQTDNASLQFAFIDAQHHEDAVMEDSSAWWRTLCDGGLMVWHDYGSRTYPGVKKAVDRFVSLRDDALPLGILQGDGLGLAYTTKVSLDSLTANQTRQR